MALISDTISNFIGGVSQQPDKLMYPNQSKEMVNFLLSPARGAIKRPPTEHIAKILDGCEVHPKNHFVNKEDGKYQVLFNGSNVSVFDLDGNPQEVTIEGNSLQYITTENPLKDLKVVTVGDYTFVINTTLKTKMKPALYQNSYPNTALIFVKQGNYGCEYVVKVDGEQKGYKKTSTSDIADCATNVITNTLFTSLQSGLGTTDWFISKVGSTITIQKKDKTSFKLECTDGGGNSCLYGFIGEADDLGLLPSVAPNGYVMKIIGENLNISDDYYVKFKTNDDSDFGNGSWLECPAPNIPYQIDETTMPHAVVRNADGTFTLKAIDWTDRLAGDEKSAKTPSFIGNCIQDMFCHKGRLGFLADDKSTYSDVNDIFSFFKSTTITELDTDPIDVGSNSRMSLLKHAVPYNKELMLFGGNSEFLIQGSGSIFSNGTVSIEMLMEYACSSLCKPIPIGSTVLFACDNGAYSKVYEVYTTDTYNIGAREVTEQVPQYIPKDLYKIFASSENNIAGFLTLQEKDAIYIYNYYYNNSVKAQSSWSKWHFKNTTILDAEFINNYVYLVMQYDDGVYLERLDISALKGDDNLDFIVYLDRKQKITPENKVINLDYTPVNNIQVINPDGFPVDFSLNGNQISLNADYNYVYIGNPYESKWKLSSIYRRKTTSQGSVKVVEGILMLKDINLSYADSNYFKVIVKPTYTTAITSTLEFTGIVNGTISASLNKITPYSSTFLIPVISNNEEIDIIIINDSYLPSCFLSLEWLGEFITRGK